MNSIDRKQTLSLKSQSVVKGACSLLVAASLVISASSFAMIDKTELNEIITELGYGSATTVKRISAFRINGFNAVDDESVILNTGASQKYLVTLNRYCRGLQHAFKIGTTTTINDLTRHDNVIVSSLGIGKEVCPIQNIYKLEDKISKT